MPHYKEHELGSADHSDVVIGFNQPVDGDALVWRETPSLDAEGAQAEIDAFPGLQNIIDLDEEMPTDHNGYWTPGHVASDSGSEGSGSRAFSFFMAG